MGAPALLAYAKAAGGWGEATIIGDGARVSPGVAAGVNAQFAYNTDFDETGPGNHAFSMIASTALAAGESVGSDGRAILAAMAVAYQLNGKFHRSLIPGRSTAGIRHLPVNVAVCAGKLVGLDRARLEQAIELAWMLAPAELDSVFRSAWWRSVGQGDVLICPAGMNAALLAEHGVEGPLGLVEAEGIYDAAGLRDLNGPEPFHYVRHEMHLKPWIGSRGTHGAIQLARQIVLEATIRPADIEEIVVQCRALYLRPPFDCPRPQAWQDAAYSVQWTIVMAILGYEPGPEWLKEERLRDPEALRLTSAIRLVEDPIATEIWESGRRFAPELSNTISIEARGQVFTRSLRAAEFLGSPQAPLSGQQVADKFLRLSVPVIGKERAANVLRWVNTLDKQADVRTLMPLLMHE